MSLIGRTTEDYSPLRGPIINPHTGRDIRPKKERQQYEQAVNARREMLGGFSSMTPKKMSKKKYEQLRAIRTPLSTDPDIPHSQKKLLAENANRRSRHAVKQLLHGHTLEMLSEEQV